MGASFSDLPPTAAWRHYGAREGVECVFLGTRGRGFRFEGHTAAVEQGHAWVVRYVISLDERWATGSARVWGWSRDGVREVVLEADGSGHWLVNGSVVHDLDGCLDVDLESSCCTNAFPVHRLQLGVGESADAPAAFVRVMDLSVERLEQHYVRADDDDNVRQRYDYRSQTFDFEAALAYDTSGLVVDYPGIGSRIV